MGARTPGFQWFVAWRYLMARPRRLSGIILLFAAVFAWVAVADGLAAAFMPATDSYISAGMPAPLWLALGLGALLAVTPVVLLYGALRDVLFSGRRPAALAAGAAVAAAVVGPVLAFVGLAAAMETGELPLLLRLGALLFVAAPAVLLCARPSAISRAMLTLVALSGTLALGLLVLALVTDEGELVASLLAEGDRAIWFEPAFLVPAVVAVLALAAAALLRRRDALRIATLAMALVPAGLAYEVWLRVVAYGFGEIVRPEGGAIFREPVFVIIPAALGGVLLLWSLLLLGIRYLFTFFTTVSIGGVAIGTMALVITLSVMSGFENDLRLKILGSNAHVLISREDEQPFADYHKVMEGVARTPGVIAMTPYLSTEVVIAGSSNYFNVVVKGVDPKSIARVTDLGDDLEDAHALDRLWPLHEDGGVGGPPDAGPSGGGAESPDGGNGIDPAPGDMNVGDVPPDDWSAGGPAPEPEPEVVDPAPDDMNVGDTRPEDWSGAEPSPTGTGTRDPLIDSIGIEGAGLVGGGGHDGKAIEIDGTWPPPAHEIAPEVAALPGVLVGRELVKQISLYVGQEVKIISPLGQNTLAGQTPYIKPYRVAGVFFTGMYEYDLKLVYVELGTLQDFLDVPDVATGIEIRVSDPEDTDTVTAALRRNIGEDYRIQDWKELNRSLFSALKLEKIAMFLVLAIIILVASFSIVGNLIMVVVEKAREIAVLKTLGASDSGVMRIFIVQGLIIGLVGTLIGVSLGLGVCYVADRFGIGIPPDVYYIDRLPVHVDLMSVLQVAAAGILISVAATIYPARIAARLRPVQGLRYE